MKEPPLSVVFRNGVREGFLLPIRLAFAVFAAVIDVFRTFINDPYGYRADDSSEKSTPP